MSHVELNSADYEIKAGSIAYGPSGSVFRCTITPVSNDVLCRLDAAVRSKGTLRLLFPGQPLLLDLVDVERIEPKGVRIAGRVRSGAARPEGASPSERRRGAPLASDASGFPVDTETRSGQMPKTQREEDKKHGDKLESLIDRTAGGSASRQREQTGEDSPEELQDDDDEDVENDDPADRRDVGEPD